MNVVDGECLQVLKTVKGMSLLCFLVLYVLNCLCLDDMLQTVAVTTAETHRHLIAGGSGTTPVIYLWEKLIPDKLEQDRPVAADTTERSNRPDNAVNAPSFF